jgi:hypothetical protein
LGYLSVEGLKIDQQVDFETRAVLVCEMDAKDRDSLKSKLEILTS